MGWKLWLKSGLSPSRSNPGIPEAEGGSVTLPRPLILLFLVKHGDIAVFQRRSHAAATLLGNMFWCLFTQATHWPIKGQQTQTRTHTHTGWMVAPIFFILLTSALLVPVLPSCPQFTLHGHMTPWHDLTPPPPHGVITVGMFVWEKDAVSQIEVSPGPTRLTNIRLPLERRFFWVVIRGSAAPEEQLLHQAGQSNGANG